MKIKKWIGGILVVLLIAILGTYFLNGELLQGRIRLVTPSGTTWYVDTIGGGDGTSITSPMLPGAAILDAENGDKIIFSAGTYLVDDDIWGLGVYVTGKDLILQGAGIGLTIMDCSLDGFVFYNATVDVIGMTFIKTMEDGDAEGETAVYALGGANVNLDRIEVKDFPLQAIYVDGEGTELIVENSYFQNNYQAIHIFNGANGYINNNKFTKNVDLAIFIVEGTESTIKNNIFFKNRVGVEVRDSEALVDGNVFEKNEWGAYAYSYDGGISNNQILNNKFLSSSVVGMSLSGSPEDSTLSANLFSKNAIGINVWDGASSIITNNVVTDQIGNGIISTGASPTIAYNTIANSGGNGITLDEGDTSYVVNNILYKNIYGLLVDAMAGAVEVGYNDAYGNTTDISGTYVDLGGNRYDDPAFVSVISFDLSSISPLINQGALYFVDDDFEGNSRTNPDIGAYEF
ncbi:MAG: right-handed parallel beta-helix repeat-containing protein [Candidatus Gracilibacteria bacterium]